MPTNNLTAKMSYDQGQTAFGNGDFDAAADHFRNAVDTDAQYVEAHERLAESYEKLGYAHRAKKAWETLSRIAKDPDLVARVTAVYEKGRHWALQNRDGLAQTLAKAAKLSPEVAARQIERTDLSNPKIEVARDAILAAGKALQAGGVIKPEVDVTAQTDQLLDSRFSSQLAAG